MYEVLMYLGAGFTYICYFTDFKVVYDSCIRLGNGTTSTPSYSTDLMKTREVNRFSIKIRVCIASGNCFAFMYACVNQLQVFMVVYLICVLFDITLLSCRGWLEYHLKKQISLLEFCPNTTMINPLYDDRTV
jgi:hypothetical protein